jgi:imidazolonepropionase
MKKAGVTPVLLPGAYYVLKETQRPDVAAMRAAGLEMAVASDLNPGTSPVASLRLALHMACTLFGLTLDEAIIGATRAAARALGEGDRLGQIRPGYACDLAIFEAETPAQIVYAIGRAPAATRVINGRTLV